MIIDRIFSLVHRHTLPASVSERLANAKRVKHPKYIFEKLSDGSYNVVTTREGYSAMMSVLFFKLTLQPVNGNYRLETKLRAFPKLYVGAIEAFSALIPIVILVEGMPMFLLVIPIFIAMPVMLFSIPRILFVDFDCNLRGAEFINTD